MENVFVGLKEMGEDWRVGELMGRKLESRRNNYGRGVSFIEWLECQMGKWGRGGGMDAK